MTNTLSYVKLNIVVKRREGSITFLVIYINMKILERIKARLKEFNEKLGTDIEDEDEMDFPEDIASELTESSHNVGKLEAAQEELWESKPTKRSKLASELIVHEDGTIKQKDGKEEHTIGKEQGEKTGSTRRNKNPRAKVNGENQVGDSERVQ